MCADDVAVARNPTTRIPNSSVLLLCHEKAVATRYGVKWPPAGTERVMIRIFIRIN